MYGSPIYYEYHLISFLSPLLEGKMKEWINLPVYGINYKTKKKRTRRKKKKNMGYNYNVEPPWNFTQLAHFASTVLLSSKCFFLFPFSCVFRLFFYFIFPFSFFFLISGFHAKRFLTTTSLIPLMRYPSGHHTADDFIILFLLFVEHCSINCYYY